MAPFDLLGAGTCCAVVAVVLLLLLCWIMSHDYGVIRYECRWRHASVMGGVEGGGEKEGAV